MRRFGSVNDAKKDAHTKRQRKTLDTRVPCVFRGLFLCVFFVILIFAFVT